jgi:phosphate transport system ATP-binding protein
MMLDETRMIHADARYSATARPLMQVRGLNLWYGDKHALKTVTFDLMARECLAFIGPSGCGKSSMLKCLNRMHDDTRGVTMTGQILLEGIDIHGPEVDPPVLRRRFGWVAQKPNPFAWSIRENIAYGAHLHGLVPEGGADGWLRRGLPAPRGPVGGGQGPSRSVGDGVVGRPAAAALHRAGAVDPT